jgi:hypothetical protein
VAGRERRVGPLEHEHRWAGRVGERAVERRETVVERVRERLRRVERVDVLADRDDRGENLRHGPWIEREHCGRTAEVLECVVDFAHVDRADGAEVLGQHEVGVEIGEGVAVEAVEVLSRRDPLGDDGVDLGRREALR